MKSSCGNFWLCTDCQCVYSRGPPSWQRYMAERLQPPLDVQHLPTAFHLGHCLQAL